MFFVSVRTRSNFSPARNVRVDDGAAVDRLQLRAYERSALARLHVLELDDAPELPVVAKMCMPLAKLLVDTTSAIGGAV